MEKGNPVVIAEKQKKAVNIIEGFAWGENFWMDGWIDRWMEVWEITTL